MCWQYASVESNGEKLMTPHDFICRFLGLIPAQNCNEETVRLLANVVDTTKDGLDIILALLLILSILYLSHSVCMLFCWNFFALFSS